MNQTQRIIGNMERHSRKAVRKLYLTKDELETLKLLGRCQ